MKNVPAPVSHPAHSLRKSRCAAARVWRPVCVTWVMFSALVCVYHLKHADAHIRDSTSSQASSSGLMKLVVACVRVTQLWAW